MTTKQFDFYIASGWFSEEQEKARQEILKVLEDFNISEFFNNKHIKYFSPKDEVICPKDAGTDFQRQVFEGNIRAIRSSRFLIVSTVGKDMGTIFEAGFASSLSIPIIYYCPGLKGNFNLMLAQTAVAVATDEDELKKHISGILENPFYFSEYKGDIE